MADEQTADQKVDIGSKLKDVFTSLKPQALSIVKFWQGIVDLVVRASVALLALLVFIMGCAMGNDLGARVFDAAFGGSRVGLGGWTAFLAFIILVVQGLMIALRFLNFAATFRYPILVILMDAIYSGVAFGLVLFTSFIPTAVYAAQFQAFGTSSSNDEINQNLINTATGISGTLAFLGFLLVVGLIAQLVWALLWYFFKWYNALKGKYEYSAEGADADYRE